MINKERLLAIPELKIAGKIKQMDEKSFENYYQLLKNFTETYPDHEERLKTALQNKAYDSLTTELSAICFDLDKIFAIDLSEDCKKRIPELKSLKPEKIETFINFFTSNLSMLSIDIQMAEKEGGGDDNNAEPRKEGDRILAIDDTAFFLTMLKTTLQDTRYKITCVTSGRDALKFLDKNTPDLILMDIEMPGMDGFELAGKIREKEKYLAILNKSKVINAPIVFLTGNAKRENVQKAMRAGAIDFILKPINKELLIEKIEKYIR